jgi:hypothetical protein
MATQSREFKTAAAANSLLNPNKKIIAKNTLNVLFGPTASADVEMAVCYPVGFNKSTGKYAPWMAPDPTKIVVTLTSAASGTWTLTVNGVDTGTIVYAPTAAAVAAALRAIGYIATVVKEAAVYTITFDAQSEIETLPTVTGTVTGISGGSPTAVADPGTVTNGTNIIKGFVYPETITTDQTDDVIGVITQECEVAYDEIADLVAVGDVTALEAALKADLVEKGIIVQGLVGVH